MAVQPQSHLFELMTYNREILLRYIFFQYEKFCSSSLTSCQNISYIGEARKIYWTYPYEWNGYRSDGNVGVFEMFRQPQNYLLEVN